MAHLIPTQASGHIVDGLSSYLTTNFALADNQTAEQLRAFLLDPENGMFNGPYVRTRLPYAPASDWDGVLGWLPKNFQPYRHQAEAFRRLSSLSSSGVAVRPSPTLVVTGTGSGKTESFLYPILDHCRRNPGAGIKAIILYPMNALASDQERRIAQLINNEPALSSVTAGLYTGEVASGGRRSVSTKGLITDRHTMRETPPDILLTNYKMLDQLLLREADRPLWEKSANVLQYLVLDEFHTYDAAQGTDVAMLLRRLGLMVQKYQDPSSVAALTGPSDSGASSGFGPLGHITPVATSATLGSKESGYDDILDFAYTVFGEKLEESAIVGETMLEVAAWQETLPVLLGRDLGPETSLPSVSEVRSILEQVATRISSSSYDSVVHDIMCEHVLHCDSSPIEAAIAAMATNSGFLSILTAASTPLPLQYAETTASGQRIAPLVEHVFTDAADRRKLGDSAAEFVNLMLSEMAYLRATFGETRGWNGKKIPGVETHLWVREISRVDRAVTSVGLGSSHNNFRWSDNGVALNNAIDGPDSSFNHWLPAIYCRHCGRSGWMIAVKPGDDLIETSVQKIRKISIQDKKRQRPLIDATSEEASGVERVGDNGAMRWLNMELPSLADKPADSSEREVGSVVPVLTYAGEDTEELALREICPACDEPDSIRYLGSSVATLLSVALSNLFGMDELDNDEKKTLVFTDSVQDAAHRAGFIQNRARAFALRTRINRAVNELCNTNFGGAQLSLLAQKMIDHARSEKTKSEQRRALFELLPPDLVYSPKYRCVWEQGASAADRRKAMTALHDRLNIDLALQFGDRVDLPRSLVMTGTLTVAVDVEDSVLLSCAKELGIISADEDLLAWARGVVEYMRIHGGIHHKWFNSYLTNDCNPYMLARRESRAKGVPAFPRNGSPVFPRSGKALKGSRAKRSNNATASLGASQGWYARWTVKSLGIPARSSFEGARLVSELFTQLEMNDVVGSVPTKTDGRVYYLKPDNIVVRREDNTEVLECTTCHLRVGVDANAREAMRGVSCYTLDCSGTFEQVAVEDNYYSRLYRAEKTRTVVSAEHTGLVPNKKRKHIEDQFKAPLVSQEADAPNVLVATPTLEMGIDIGDLSTVMLSSMPHSVASYVQRVGRAGRLSGNSLVVATVRGRGMSLTKLEHPLETVAGNVTAPAAYLSARDIMHRQFVAYLLDSHSIADQVASMASAYDVFTTMNKSVLDVLLEILSGDISEDLQRFSTTLEDHTSTDVLDELASWATSPNGLSADIVRARSRWNETHMELLQRLNVLEEQVSELATRRSAMAIEDDDLKNQYDTTEAARWFTQKQLNNLKDEHWVAALERYGLLPNFTLLDDAVEFHLSVSSFNEELGGFETEALEYTRGISSALVELAPGNTFYVQGVAAKVDSVEIGRDASAVTQWRLCPACSHSEPVVAGQGIGAACPSCGAAAYADQKQVVDVVEMNRVYASVDQSNSAIRDFDEDRTSKRFQTQLSFSIPDGGQGESWYLVGSGFGLQYLPQIDMRWLNLGSYEGGSPREFAGNSVDAPLFRVCQHCGHIDSQAGSNSWKDHRPWCKQRNAEQEESITFALGRKLNTQGVLLHLPALLSVMESTTLPSLLTALKLGFKMYLGGNPDHLDIEPVRTISDGDVADLLLIHDKVPGGTGYLAQFTNPTHVRGLLEVAYNHLVQCHCAGEEREACPSCLLPYARSEQVPVISRTSAMVAISKILADDMHLNPEVSKEEWTWDNKITTVQPARSDQSKLEQRFIELLRQDLKNKKASVKESVVNDHAHWTIRFPNSNREWVLKEQVNLGSTIPDLLLSTTDPAIRDIAVYLDGALYHASSTHNRVADDFKKRNELYARDYLPWTITWQDLDKYEAVSKKKAYELPLWHSPETLGIITKSMKLNPDDIELMIVDPLTQLIAMMQKPSDGAQWTEFGRASIFNAAFGGSMDPKTATAKRSYLNAVEVVWAPANLRVSLNLDGTTPLDEDAWRMFTGLSNFAYLKPTGSVIEIHGAASADPVATNDSSPTPDAELPDETDMAEERTSSLETTVWNLFAEEYEGEDSVINALHALNEARLPAPQEDTIGAEIAQVIPVVAWTDKKVALVYAEDIDVLEAAGYKAMDVEALEVELLRQWLGAK